MSRIPSETPQPEPDTSGSPPPEAGGLALVMSGGGARAAYQVGFLRFLARRFPDLRVPVITGVSAGAINAALLASHHGTFAQAVDELASLWSDLTVEEVFRADVASLGGRVLRWGLRLVSGGAPGPRVRGLVDTEPLRHFLTEALHAVDGELTGIRYNLQRRRLRAVALTTSNFTTGQSVVWVQGSGVQMWTRPQRRAVATTLTVEHVMASAALPIFFPAVRIGSDWYGDGGIRQAAPLSPALHLGARRIMAISTRYARSQSEADTPSVEGYPPPAQVLGVLMNSIFLDVLDQDALRLERMNMLLEKLPEAERGGLRPVDLLVMRPSRDLGKMAGDHEPELPRTFRFLTRGMGTRETRSSDALSLVLFQPEYLQRIMETGEQDAEARAEEIEAFVAGAESLGAMAPAGRTLDSEAGSPPEGSGGAPPS